MVNKISSAAANAAQCLRSFVENGTFPMKLQNGRLSEAETLDEVWPRQRKLPAMW